jgi:hypothetical protein
MAYPCRIFHHWLSDEEKLGNVLRVRASLKGRK